MTEIVLPSHANNLGTIFGGVVMQWIDVCAAMAATRHCRRTVVTAAVDELEFRTPIHPGDFVILSAQVNAAFRTSMEVGVQVDSEDPRTGVRRRQSPGRRRPASSDDLSAIGFRFGTSR